ncbi:MAG: sporulation protein YabP [Desulfitobacteriaceae bacterium]|nr:sporulation protein YabP [Desulfitobacteriaceae bacterium]MDI6878057.1 sporulation protein YabP [Desulfitobacteriaceae bacterium]MDI6913927.1 sporulation protein YabP [Desulfitobacteriaceae bacterium]
MEKTKGHRLVLQDRGNITITGVVKIQTVDPKEIVLDTEQGMLNIKGEKLEIKQLDLQNGSLEINGHVDALVYLRQSQGGSRGSLLGKIFK